MPTPATPPGLPRLRGLEAMGMRMALYVAPGPGTGWRPLREVVAPAGAEEMVSASQDRWGGPRDAHGSWVVESLAWHLGMATALPLLAGGAAPPLAPERLWARVGPAGRVEGLACEPEPWTAGADPVEEARAGLAAALAPLVRHLADLGIRSPAHLHRSAGDSLALAGLWAGMALDRRDEAVRLTERILAPPAPYAVPLQLSSGPDAPPRRRAGCCLAYRVPHQARCDDCPAGALRRAAAVRHRVPWLGSN